jgi:DNA-binding CsgD family transcriptional regulator
MGRRKRWIAPLPGAKPPSEPPEIFELISDDDKAGIPLPPFVVLTPRSPPLEIIELYPSPLPPPPPPITRENSLARLQVGFTALSDDELRVAHLWLTGKSLDDVCDGLGMTEEKVRNLWQHMRWKIRLALEGKEPVGSPPGVDRKR